MRIHNALEKRFLNQFLDGTNYYVGDEIASWRLDPGQLRQVGSRAFQIPTVPMPASLAIRHPEFAAKFKKFLTNGIWPTMIEKWNQITPLPLPG